MTKATQPRQQDNEDILDEKKILDLHISSTVIDFANALHHRYNIELAKCEQSEHELDKKRSRF
jgi:hypothetical protein